jgi:oligopeptide transport system permease protein
MTQKTGSEDMAKYTLKRLGWAILTLLVIASLTFLLMNSIPGGPWSSEKALSAQTIQALNEKYGLDKPLVAQLGIYLKNVCQGDMGVSFKMQKNRPVVDIIKEKFPVSAKVGFFALLWAIIVGVPLGCIAAYKRGTWVDSLLRVICTIGVSIPSFVIASLLIERFAGANASTRIFPTIFDASLGAKSYVMPAFALGLYPMCYTARQARSSMLDALGQDYIKTARAKGLTTNRIIFKHALRNALIPVITFLGPEIAFVFCGGFVIEKVFSIPGLGRYFVQSILARDYPVIMGTTIFLASFIILMNLVVDILYHVVDPRIELAGGEN